MAPTICYKGMVFVNMDDTGATKVTDINTDTIAYVIPAPVINTDSSMLSFSYFIESSGELLGVHWSEGISKTHAYGLDVYRLDDRNTNQWRWVKMSNISDRILFLFLFRCGGFSFGSSEVGGHRGNCIYYKMFCEHLMRYDIKECIAEKVFCGLSLSSDMCWFVPGT